MSVRRLALGALVLVAGCTHPTTTSTDPTRSAAQASIRETIDALNAAVTRPVAAQQTALSQLLDAGQRAAQAKCPAATSTLEFLPVWASLAPAPGWHPPTGTMSGPIYSLPTLIRIHRQDRITGTDLTDLHLAVSGDTATLPSLCVS